MASQPQLAEEVMQWLSTQARAVLNSYLLAPPKPVIDGTDNSNLPEILVSPPWRSKKKMTAPRLDLAPLELTPQVYWQPGEQEWLASTESARYFSTESLAERMEQKSGRVVLQELGFGDDVWLFLNYILPGKLDAARNSLIVQWHYYQGRVEEILNGWNSPEAQLAEQALRSGHIEALINIWENDNYSRYRPEKSVWNLYLLAQLPREMALTFWLRINEKKHLFAGEDYFLSILGLDALPGLMLAFLHRPKETFPLILNFGATENWPCPLPASGDVSRCSVIWLASGFYIGRNIRLLHLSLLSSPNPAIIAKLHYLPCVYFTNRDMVNCCKPWQTAGSVQMYGLPWSIY